MNIETINEIKLLENVVLVNQESLNWIVYKFPDHTVRFELKNDYKTYVKENGDLNGGDEFRGRVDKETQKIFMLTGEYELEIRKNHLVYEWKNMEYSGNLVFTSNDLKILDAASKEQYAPKTLYDAIAKMIKEQKGWSKLLILFAVVMIVGIIGLIWHLTDNQVAQ
jgi:hypothetical protein